MRKRIWMMRPGNAMREAGAVFLLRASTYLGPLLVLPLVARKLGPAGLGAYAAAQGIAALVTLAVEFGFGFTATALAARKRGSRLALGALIASVQGAQLVLAAGCGLPVAAAAPWLPEGLGDMRLLGSAWAHAAAGGMTLSWFWLGTGQLARVAWIEPPARTLPLEAAAFLVDRPGDAWLLLALPAAGLAAAAALSRILALRHAAWVWPAWRRAMRGLRLGGKAVPFRAAETLLSGANSLLMGFFCPALAVGQFAAAEKLIRPMASLLLDPLQRAAQHLKQPLHPSQVVIVGDTPADIACARAIGARAVAVATGFASREELAAASPDHLLDDLSTLSLLI